MDGKEENKIKKTEDLHKRIKKRTGELVACYSFASADTKVDKDIIKKIKTYRSLINHLAFIDVMLQEFQEDILAEGFQVKYMNGKNQWGYKRNESVDLFKKWYSDRLSDSERLKKLLAIEDAEFDDGFDEICNR
jgi:hypothetical protein